jgi:hypothetical protein
MCMWMLSEKIMCVYNLETMLQLKQEFHYIMLQFCLFDEQTYVIVNQENGLWIVIMIILVKNMMICIWEMSLIENEPLWIMKLLVVVLMYYHDVSENMEWLIVAMLNAGLEVLARRVIGNMCMLRFGRVTC